MSDIVVLCHDDLQTRLLALPDTKANVVVIDNIPDLLDKQKGVTTPVYGILYEGMRSQEPTKDTHKVGLMGELVMSIICVFPTNKLGATKYVDGTTVRDRAIGVLGVIRRAIINTRSPSQHFWRFNLEAPALEKNGVVLWVQRWSTPVTFL